MTSVGSLIKKLIVNLLCHAGSVIFGASIVYNLVSEYSSIRNDVSAKTEKARKLGWLMSMAIFISGCGYLVARDLFPEISARQMPLARNASPFSPGAGSGWVDGQLDNGVWHPQMDIVAVEDLPDETFAWDIADRVAIMANNTQGGHPALLENCSIGFRESTCRMAYFVRTSTQWSAPLVLGSSKFDHDGRTIAVGDRGCSFATWVTADLKFVGRWIGRCADPTFLQCETCQIYF